MGYEVVEKSLTEFDEIIARLKITIEPDSYVGRDIETTREFLSDRRSLDDAGVSTKWNPRFKEFYHAQIVVKRLTDAVIALRDQKSLKSRLKQVLGGSLTQDHEPSQAKDFFYELELAALWIEGGFKVELSEPDIVVSGNGLSSEVGVACKYPTSWEQIHEHFSKGYRQITRHGYTGLVAVGIDALVFQGMANYLDFRQGDKHPLEVMEKATSEVMTNLVHRREQDYPAEKPIDGALLTLRAIGIWGNPAQLTQIGHATLQCDQKNPRFADFRVLYDGLSKLRTTT